MKTPNLWASWKQKAHSLELQTLALYYAYRDPRVPWYAKALTGLLVAYAFSPIDLIPDFIPLLGYLDDLVILPLGVAILLRLIPPQVMEDCRAQAAHRLEKDEPYFPFMAVIFIVLWILAALLVGLLVYRAVKR